MTGETTVDVNHRIWEVLKADARKVMRSLDHNSMHASAVNNRLLERLIRDNADTEFGRAHGFASMHGQSDYRKRVPLSTYSDYEEAVRRMVEQGESNIICAYPITYYARSSGTASEPKKIPVSDRGLTIFRDYASAILPGVFSEFHQCARGHDFPDGYRCMVANFSREPLENGTPYGLISGACLDDAKAEAMRHFVSTPAAAMTSTDDCDMSYLHARFGLAHRDITLFTGSYMPSLLDLVEYIRDNWRDLTRDIREGKLSESARISDSVRAQLVDELKPDPDRATELEAVFQDGFGYGVLTRIWPNLSGAAAIWAGAMCPYARKLQQYTGRTVPFYTMTFGASEGSFAVARRPFDRDYVLLPDSCFFEFIPMGGQGDSGSEGDPETVLLDEVAEGMDYELVITNQSGLWRYRMGDIVRVTGFYNESPTLSFRYRLSNSVTLVDETLSEGELLDAVNRFARRCGIEVLDCCIRPDLECDPPRYVIYVEPNDEMSDALKDRLSQAMHEGLAGVSRSYAALASSRRIGKPKVVLLKQGTFRVFREKGKRLLGPYGAQMKTVRVLRKPEVVNFFTQQEDGEE